jgi:tRNA-dihydrouridine synthase
MIIASGFNRSQACRDSEFSTCLEDQPLIVQFAAKDPVELGMAAEKCLTAVQAIDLNCGCPQKWAVHDGIGAALSRQPQLVAEMVAETRKRVHNFPLAIKIRILPDLRQTIDLVQRAEKAGVSWITVHGRTPAERHTPVHYDAIAAIKAVAKVPIVANGDIFRVADMERVVKETKVDGVMLARGALANPAVFGGLDVMPLQCPVRVSHPRAPPFLLAPCCAAADRCCFLCGAQVDYLRYALEYGGLFKIHHHHLACTPCLPIFTASDGSRGCSRGACADMSFSGFTRAEQREFSGLSSLAGVIDFFSRRGWWPSADSTATSSAGASGSKAAAAGASADGGVAASSSTAGSETSSAGAGAAGGAQGADQQTEKTGGSQTA